MKTKGFLTALLLAALILSLFSISAVAQSGPAKGGRPTGTPPPEEPPVPTETPDTGSLYGDLYVILRDENGVPILKDVVLDVPVTEETPDGGTVVVWCIQPISLISDSATIETYNGTEMITVYEGEPFVLPSYFDTAGDLVECELTEDMADWVEGVDFGRLNLGRAPDAVIAHAFDEAINKMNAATAFDLDPSGRIMMLIDNEWFTIDAPAENLALYIKMMQDGHWITTDTTSVTMGGPPAGKGPPEGDGPSTEPRPVLTDEAISLLQQYIQYGNLGDVNNQLNNHDLLLAASLLAGAADKTGTMTLDKVVYINAIYGINFDFSTPNGGNPYIQDRGRTFRNRTSGGCGAGWIWVLQPTDRTNLYETKCVEILGKVHFNDYREYYRTLGMEFDYDENVRGFAQSADDALQVLEYIHNYKVPEDIYAP